VAFLENPLVFLLPDVHYPFSSRDLGIHAFFFLFLDLGPHAGVDLFGRSRHVQAATGPELLARLHISFELLELMNKPDLGAGEPGQVAIGEPVAFQQFKDDQLSVC